MRSASSEIATDMRMMIIIFKEDGKGEVDVGVFLLYLTEHWPMKFDSFHLGGDGLVDGKMMNSWK